MSMLQTIREKLRPVLLRRYGARKEAAKEALLDAGASPADVNLYLAGFDQGWVSGAEDVTSVGFWKFMQDRRRARPEESH